MLQLSAANWPHYKQLMRMDRPIGSYLLLWPTYWALLLAADGLPPLLLLAVFTAGVFVMRSAGCVINDYADRHVDGHVERTRSRPLAAGLVTEKEALQLFAVLIAIALGLVLTLNWPTVQLSVVALGLAVIYPFMKRYTYLPQAVLGAAFGWSIPMAIMATLGHIPLWGWLLFFANLVWTVAYDTFYAMVDRDDDVQIGVKSSAILFGRFDRLIIGVLQLATLVLLVSVFQLKQLAWPAYAGLVVMGVLFVKQQYSVRDGDRGACFNAFLNNHYAGLAVVIGIAAAIYWPLLGA